MALVRETDAGTALVLPDALRDMVAGLLRLGALNPWCGLCGAPAERWGYELARTDYRTLAAAEPELRQQAAKQAVTRAMWGDLHKTRPQ
jgi:hypothetical protein